MGARRKARECALQMLFASDVADTTKATLTRDFWNHLSDEKSNDITREFANKLVLGTLRRLTEIDNKIRTRAEHWRIERMAIVDRNVLRLAVNEFLFEDTPHTVVINESLEIARRFSTYEATQFINGILDAIKKDLEKEKKKTDNESDKVEENKETSSEIEETKENSNGVEETKEENSKFSEKTNASS